MLHQLVLPCPTVFVINTKVLLQPMQPVPNLTSQYGKQSNTR